MGPLPIKWGVKNGAGNHWILGEKEKGVSQFPLKKNEGEETDQDKTSQSSDKKHNPSPLPFSRSKQNAPRGEKYNQSFFPPRGGSCQL